MQHRYGAMGAFDAGRYATPLIARVNAIGETATASFKKGFATFVIEQGIGGQLARPPTGFPSSGWNDFADPNVGSSYVGARSRRRQPGRPFSARVALRCTRGARTTRTSRGVLAKGHINVLGADARLTWGRLGHLYARAPRAREASNAGVVAGVVEILNARGGPGLVSEYLGPQQRRQRRPHDVRRCSTTSASRARCSATAFAARTPTCSLSLFGIGTKVSSDDTDHDGVLKLKAGVRGDVH